MCLSARSIVAIHSLTLFAMLASHPAVHAGAQQFVSPQFAQLSANHRTIAILPFRVTIAAKNLPKHTTPEMVEKMQSDEALEFQRQMYARFLSRAATDGYRVEFQDIDQTNTLLLRAGISMDSLGAHTKDEVARALGVDALVSGSIRMSKPTSTGAAFAQTLLLGFSGSTERVDINMTLHDGANASLLWSYDHTDKGGMANSSEAMAKSLFKKVAGNFPYRLKK